MRRFKIDNVNHKLYFDMLTYIGEQCKDFEVVISRGRHYEELSEIEKELNDFYLGYKYVKRWAGNRGGGIMRVYSCTPESANVFKSYNDFFDFGNLDLCFYKDGREFLFTIPHEHHIEGIYDYWEPFFNRRMNYWGDYELEIRPMNDFKYDDSDKDRSNLKPVEQGDI